MDASVEQTLLFTVRSAGAVIAHRESLSEMHRNACLATAKGIYVEMLVVTSFCMQGGHVDRALVTDHSARR